METSQKYARIERERRFILDRFPAETNAIGVRRITDRYIERTRLRLRHQVDDRGPTTFKLTQKIPSQAAGAQQGFLTTMYLTAEEFQVFAGLPAKQLQKTRYRVPPFGIDVFEGSLGGLILVEAEFESAADAESFTPPPFVVREVSGDVRFTGGRLAQASRHAVQKWRAEYGLDFSAPPSG